MDGHVIWEIVVGVILAAFAAWLTRQGQIRDKQDEATDKRAAEDKAAMTKRIDAIEIGEANRYERLIRLEERSQHLPTAADLDRLRSSSTNDCNNLREAINLFSRDMSKELGKLQGDQGVQLKMLMRMQDKLGTADKGDS